MIVKDRKEKSPSCCCRFYRVYQCHLFCWKKNKKNVKKRGINKGCYNYLYTYKIKAVIEIKRLRIVEEIVSPIESFVRALLPNWIVLYYIYLQFQDFYLFIYFFFSLFWTFKRHSRTYIFIYRKCPW